MAAPAWHRSDNPAAYNANASFVYSAAATAPVLALLALQPHERILDVGCGSGELTAQLGKALAESGGSVVATDVAQSMLDAAAKLDAPNVQWHCVDGQQLEAWLEASGERGAFDRVFSNAAIHWMNRDPAAVVRGAFAALKSGGTFAAELGGFGNTMGVRGGLHAALRRRGVDPTPHDPWFFPTADAYTELLRGAGFAVEAMELAPRPTKVPSGVRGWLKTFGGPFLAPLRSDAEREAVVQEVEELLRPDAYDAAKDEWTIMYVRLRFRAVKP